MIPMPGIVFALLGTAFYVGLTAICLRLVTTDRLTPGGAAAVIGAAVLVPLVGLLTATLTAQELLMLALAAVTAALLAAMVYAITRPVVRARLTPPVGAAAIAACGALIVLGFLGTASLVA
jgi:hypothetical protein